MFTSPFALLRSKAPLLFPGIIRILIVIPSLLAGILIGHTATAQAELAPWGNLTGIRTEGELMEFESSLCLVRPGGTEILFTGKEKQRPKYERQGSAQIVTTALDHLSFREIVKDSTTGPAMVSVEVQAIEDQAAEGVYLCFTLNRDASKQYEIRIDGHQKVNIPNGPGKSADTVHSLAKSITIHSSDRQFRLDFEEPTSLILRQADTKDSHSLRIYVLLQAGNLSKDTLVKKTLVVTASGSIDKSPVIVQIDPSKPGRPFDGFGGNFRLQNPKTDPPVIQYCLDNLRVAWGRVEMPWRLWQPQKEDRPLDSAKNGKLHPAVRSAMEMAQRLSKKGMPIILSAWSAPNWAIVGTPRFRPGNDGVWGNPLDKTNMQEIYASIADYIIYLRDEYNVEIGYFSFNESDLGINIRLTGQEHAELIKGLGAYFEQRGLKTRMLLGDNSDATTYKFIDPALDDTSAYRYIGAVSFHSWRGWEKETLQKWADASVRVKRPLIVAEGSIDAQAWGYPAIFGEPVYALEEISLYVRLLAICQPASILQWQLTADYSPLSGGGIFGNNEPLHPTQRFWNLKQLAATPTGLRNIPATADKPNISVAALGNSISSRYTIHLVNRGASRPAKLTGLPASVKSLRCWITDKDRSMQEEKAVPVSKGVATFKLEAGTYTTLSSD